MNSTTTTTTTSTRWRDYHQRADAVRTLLAGLGSGADDLPWDDDLAAVFLDRDDLLETLHAVWTRRLLGRVDLELEIGSGTPRESVETAWRATCDDLPALRALLDRHADSDVARRCVAGEHRLLAVAAGLATLSDPTPHSARIGARLVGSFRPLPNDAAPSHHRFGWLRAFRHAPTAA